MGIAEAITDGFMLIHAWEFQGDPAAFIFNNIVPVRIFTVTGQADHQRAAAVMDYGTAN